MKKLLSLLNLRDWIFKDARKIGFIAPELRQDEFGDPILVCPVSGWAANIMVEPIPGVREIPEREEDDQSKLTKNSFMLRVDAGEILRVTEGAFYYRGEEIQDAGEAHKALVAAFREVKLRKDERDSDSIAFNEMARLAMRYIPSVLTDNMDMSDAEFDRLRVLLDLRMQTNDWREAIDRLQDETDYLQRPKTLKIPECMLSEDPESYGAHARRILERHFLPQGMYADLIGRLHEGGLSDEQNLEKLNSVARDIAGVVQDVEQNAYHRGIEQGKKELSDLM